MKKRSSWNKVGAILVVLSLSAFFAQAVGFTRLHDFSLAPGAFRAELLSTSGGALYGTASRGGVSDHGCIFKLEPSGVASMVVSFVGTNGANPCGCLVLSSNGMLYGTTFYGGPTSGDLASAGKGTVFRVSPEGELSAVAYFNGPNGANPNGALLQAQDGKLYGVTHSGGASDLGTVFSIDLSGQLLSLFSFQQTNGANPCGNLTEDGQGNLYGTTTLGGANGLGTVYKLTKEGQLTTLVCFDGTNGAYPYAGVTFASDGKLYGTTQFGGAQNKGSAFSLTTNGVLTTLVTFDGTNGAYPCAPVSVGPDGLLYGTTSGGGEKSMGTVFKMSLDGSLTTTASLNEEHCQPQATVAFDDDGNLYGTTYNGSQGDGSVFRIEALSGEVSAFGNFSACQPYAALLPGTNASFFGLSTRGRETVFQCSPSRVYEELNANLGSGACADTGLIQGTNGNLYGMTSSGGTHKFGSVFMLTPEGALSNLFSFHGTDGAVPAGKLVEDSDGNFWGVTFCGGEFYKASYRDPVQDGYGTIFKITPAGVFTNVVSFDRENGANPTAGLTKDSAGNLYGTTRNGGTGNCGTAFKVSASGVFTHLVSFGANYSACPESPLVLAADGNFYGTTHGAWGSYGSVFRMTPAGGLTTLKVFNFSDGAFPTGGLVQGSDGSFYGTTSMGGPAGHGTIFKLTAGGELTTLVSFNGQNGALPWSELVKGQDGSFYGTTASGGAGGGGTLFRLTLEPKFVPPCGYNAGVFAGNIYAEAGQSFTIQFSTDLCDWHDLATITNSIGTNWVSDMSLPASAKFYRAVSR